MDLSRLGLAGLKENIVGSTVIGTGQDVTSSERRTGCGDYTDSTPISASQQNQPFLTQSMKSDDEVSSKDQAGCM